MATLVFDLIIGALLGLVFAWYRSRATLGPGKLSARYVVEYVIFGVVIMIAIEIRRYFLPVE